MIALSAVEAMRHPALHSVIAAKSTTIGSRSSRAITWRNAACVSAVVAVLVRGWKLTMFCG